MLLGQCNTSVSILLSKIVEHSWIEIIKISRLLSKLLHSI